MGARQGKSFGEICALLASWPLLALIGSSQERTSREGLANVGDKIVRMLDPDRHANQRRSNSDFTTGLFREPGMHCRRGMANQGFRSAQTDRQFEYLETIEESERVRLISFDVEG